MGLPIKNLLRADSSSKLDNTDGQQQLYLQYKVCWILYKMVGAPSFSQPYLCM